METVDIPELVQSLGSGDDGPRKKAAFRLQSLIGDPSFADSFVAAGGLPKLQYLCINATGNTLAYTLACCSNILDLDQGWDMINSELIERLVQLVVAHPLVTILRGAMSILSFIVSHPSTPSETGSFGSRALQPSLELHPNFLEMLVSRLSSPDHALCANALQLINALMRDSLVKEHENEWPKFINRLQDLGVIKAVYVLMQSSGLQDLAHPLLDFQSLTKILLRKWREIGISTERVEHRRALRAIYLSGSEERRHNKDADVRPDSVGVEPRHWRRLGFDTETPAPEFEEVGFLGMMDLTDFTRKSEDGFRNILLEQSSIPTGRRCPVAKASLAITSILFDHFEVDRSDAEDQQRYITLDTRSNYDKVFKPLLLQWSRLHTSGLQAFFRLWATTGAERDDFNKIEELVRILIEHVVGLAARTVDIQEVEQQIANYELRKLRELQMELLELTHEDAWGQHLRQIKDDLKHEALQFIREQRVRCLLQGAWFPNLSPNTPSAPQYNTRTPSWRFARLSYNRRYLHYSDFDLRPAKGTENPNIDTLENRIDLTSVTSVVSNMAPNDFDDEDMDGDADTSTQNGSVRNINRRPPSSLDQKPPATNPKSALATGPQQQQPSSPVPITMLSATAQSTLKPRPTNTTITIYGYASAASNPATTAAGAQQGSNTTQSRTQSSQPFALLAKSGFRKDKASKDANAAQGLNSNADEPEEALLALHPQTTTVASEWLDGLLLLLNQTPITADTNKLVSFIAKYGLRIRLLNVRFEEGGIVRDEEGHDGAADTGAAAGDGASTGPNADQTAGLAYNDNDIAGATVSGNAASYGYSYAYSGWANREVVLPSRDGVDDDFFYDVGGV